MASRACCALAPRPTVAALRCLGWSLLAVVAAGLGSAAAQGQLVRQSREVPNADYFRALSVYYEGDYALAMKAFRQAARSGIQIAERRWVDSICYYTMLGECYYRTGDLGQALQQYDAACDLFVAHQNWMLRVDFPAGLSAQGRVAGRPYTWATSQRPAVAAQVPDRLLTQVGRMDNEEVVRRGGVVAPAELYTIVPTEIARCTMLAILRRREIMGPTCAHAARTALLLDALARGPARPNHWTQRWIEGQLGLASASAGKVDEGIAQLQQSLLISGQFNHPLTATALLGLGQLAMERSEYQAAESYYLEATFAAAMYSQYDMMEDGFRGALHARLSRGKHDLFAPLVPATVWAHRYSKSLEASLLLLSAENQAEMGQSANAQTMLSQARRAMRRNEMNSGPSGARMQFVSALTQMQDGNASAGLKILSQAIGLRRPNSPWLFQIALADQLYTSGKVSDRVAGLLYEELLREPLGKDWIESPLDALTYVTTPSAVAMERWFEVALKRKETERAMEISERIRRQRFYSTLPLGGRLLALRWVLEAPPEALSQSAMLQRQDLLLEFPRYADLSRKVAAVRTALQQAPLIPEEGDARRRQAEQLAALGKLSAAEETLLYEMALRRAPSEFVFPPLLDFPTLQQQLPERHLLMAFFATSRNMYCFLVARGNYAERRLQNPRQLQGEVAELLRTMGQYERNQPLGLEELASDSWKDPAQQLLAHLTENASADFWSQFDELIVVPDGALWYAPFAALQAPGPDGPQPLISKVRIRCAPLASLAVPDRRGVRPAATTAVVLGQLFPRNDESLAERALQDLQNSLPGALPLPATLPGPSEVFASICPRLIVLSDLEDSDRGPYQWSPIPLDRGRAGSSLEGWFPLPWGGPEQMVLPGFHTVAENALKRGGAGDDLFLTVCGLMASGARTILLSTWRTGGQTSYDLTREFAQELPHTTAAEAWQRSVQLTMFADVDPLREPRVDEDRADKALKAAHPFFWAGYLLIDTGAAPPAAKDP